MRGGKCSDVGWTGCFSTDHVPFRLSQLHASAIREIDAQTGFPQRLPTPSFTQTPHLHYAPALWKFPRRGQLIFGQRRARIVGEGVAFGFFQSDAMWSAQSGDYEGACDRRPQSGQDGSLWVQLELLFNIGPDTHLA